MTDDPSMPAATGETARAGAGNDPAVPEAIGEKPQVIVGISFSDTYRAREFMTVASRLAAEHDLALHDVVLVTKDADGKVNVVETVDPPPGRLAFSGAMWSSLLGLVLGGPVGWVVGAAAGAGAGAVTAKFVDLGIPDEWVDWFREAVQPDTATVAILASDIDTEALLAEARRFAGAHLVYANLDDATFDRLAEALGDTHPYRPPS